MLTSSRKKKRELFLIAQSWTCCEFSRSLPLVLIFSRLFHFHGAFGQGVYRSTDVAVRYAHVLTVSSNLLEADGGARSSWSCECWWRWGLEPAMARDLTDTQT